MGIIAHSAKQAFLNRPRIDFREYKNLTEEQLEERMLKLPVRPPIFYKLTYLQKVCFIIGAETRRFMYLNDTGTGKSLLSIALARYFRRLGLVKHILILVPNRPNKVEWPDELAKHSPNSSYLVLPSEIKKKWESLETSNHLFTVETYAGLFNMVCDAEPNKKGKNRFVISAKKIKKLQKHFQGVVCDESVALSNHQALPFRICRQLSKTSEVFFELTGTPFNRDPTVLWSQMFLIDGGYTLGETLGLFRAIFCNESINYFSGMPEYKFSKKQKGLLNKFIANQSISFPADEGSLPECVPVAKFISLGTDADSYYQRFKDALVAARGNFQESQNAFIRMRQISSGFIGFEDDETGEKAKIEFPENPKLELLTSVLQSVYQQHKSIVFFEFNFSGERIIKELKKLKINAQIIYGKTKDVEDAKRQFMQNDKVRVLLLQNRMGAGLNIQVAKYGIFYESPVSAIMRKQCQRRVERQHSLHKTVFIYDLLMRGTVDEQILQFHKEGGDLFEAIIRGK